MTIHLTKQRIYKKDISAKFQFLKIEKKMHSSETCCSDQLLEKNQIRRGVNFG